MTDKVILPTIVYDSCTSTPFEKYSVPGGCKCDVGYHQIREAWSTIFAGYKDLTLFNDEKISDWLDISVKTYRSYKKPDSILKPRVKEQAIMALSVIKHGIEVFGSEEGFSNWLTQKNFYFDKKAPIEFMNTNSGIKFIDDRLTGIEYGDNV